MRAISLPVLSGIGVVLGFLGAGSAADQRFTGASTVAPWLRNGLVLAPPKPAIKPIKPRDVSNFPASLTLDPQEATTRPADRKRDNGKSERRSEKTERTSEHKVTVTEEETGRTHEHPYRGVSDFFNIREANSNVEQCEWEFEIGAGWVTNSDGSDDDVKNAFSLKYGVTDDLYVGLKVLPLNYGDGGDQGNGDLALVLFNQFVHESECVPAVAGWAEMRIPSGQGSSGVDGTFHLNVTKSLNECWRVHMEGFVETANGGRGGEDVDRRNFQWGTGPGIDYTFADNSLAVLNYLHRSSEKEEHHNQNILQLGYVRELCPGQHLKAAVDIGLDGAEETPNFAAKLLWSIAWK